MSRTSSKVSATSSRAREAPLDRLGTASKREGPPSLLGDAVLDWGRVEVAMDKGNTTTRMGNGRSGNRELGIGNRESGIALAADPNPNPNPNPSPNPQTQTRPIL